MKHLTTSVNAYIIWPHIRCWIYCIQEIQDMCWRFSFVKQCPSMHSTTWSTDGFHTIKRGGTKWLSFLLCEPGSSSCGCTCQFLCGSHSTRSSSERLINRRIPRNDCCPYLMAC